MFDLFLLLLSFFRPVRLLRWGAFLAVVCVGWLMMENATLQAYLKERARRDEYRDQVAHLQQQQKQYEVELAQLKAGGFSLEQVIRERFDLRYPGEKVIDIETPATPPARSAEADERERMAQALMATTPTEATEPLQIVREPDEKGAAPAIKGIVKKKTAATEETGAAAETEKPAASVKRAGKKKSGVSGSPAKSRTSTKAGKSKKRAASAN